MTQYPLILLGASIRGAAQSAAVSQIPTWGADLFADTDTQFAAPVVKVHDYPLGLQQLAEQRAPSLWMYTGALENVPAMVERLSKTHCLVGNPASVLAVVRDFERLEKWAKQTGLKTPQTMPLAEFRANLGRWLQKSRHSSAGFGIQWLTGQTPHASSRLVAQRWVDGQPGSCVFVSFPEHCELVGATHQLSHGNAQVAPDGGCSATDRFHYRGSYGPASLDSISLEKLQAFGTQVTLESQIRGVWCVDYVASDDLFLLEINPRWSASMEILERLLSRQLLREHLLACQPWLEARARERIDAWLDVDSSKIQTLMSIENPPALPSISSGSQPEDLGLPLAETAKPTKTCWGKCIVYADVACRVTERLLEQLARWNQGSLPSMPIGAADIPHLGAVINQGHPICTVLASGDTDQAVLSVLESRENVVRKYVSIL